MPGVERAGDAATCGDPNTGSPTVRANGAGITRVNIDKALGLIIGPGSQTVFVEGYPVSLPGDVILPHPCCGAPGCGPHCAATTTSESTNVFANTGFPTETITNESGISQTGTTAPDVVVTAWGFLPISVPSVPATGFSLPGLEASGIFLIGNLSSYPTGPFTVGLFETPNGVTLGSDDAGLGPFMLTDEGATYIGANKVDEKIIQIGPFGTFAGEFTFDIGGRIPGKYYFSIYADIYEELYEPDEDNTFLGMQLTIT